MSHPCLGLSHLVEKKCPTLSHAKKGKCPRLSHLVSHPYLSVSLLSKR